MMFTTLRRWFQKPKHRTVVRPENRFRLRPRFDQLEDRVVPAMVDLTPGVGTFGTINGAVYEYTDIDGQSTGTGVFDTFVQIQRGGNEEGYNYDRDGVVSNGGSQVSPQFNEKNDAPHNHLVQLSDVPLRQFDLDENGLDENDPWYRQFRLDIAESGNEDSVRPLLSLDSVQIFLTAAPPHVTGGDSDGYSAGTLTDTDGTLYSPIYDMDANATDDPSNPGTDDNWVKLKDLLNGNGKGDMFLYVPASLFSGSGDQYVTLYSSLGFHETYVAGTETDSSFDEWSFSTEPPNTLDSSIVTIDRHPSADTAYDTATLSTTANGGPVFTGTVTYTLYEDPDGVPENGDETAIAYHTVTVNGTVPDSNIIDPNDGPLDAGSYYYIANYSGDGTYAPATGDPEPFSVVEITALVTIEVHKFEDNNGDGTRNGADADIAWDITIEVGAYSFAVTTGTPEAFDNNNDNDTDDVGEASFDGNTLTVTVLDADLAAGISWSAEEASVPGWTPTTDTIFDGTLTTAESSAIVEFGNFENIVISGYKFYDVNTDGDFDGVANGEGKIPGWTITVYNDNDASGDISTGDTTEVVTTTDAQGNYQVSIPHAGQFLIVESTTPPTGFTQTGWMPTTDILQATAALQSGGTGSAIFGNVELGKGGGLTLGFWSNKNGKAAMTNGPGGMTGALSSLSVLNLRKADGSNFDPATYDQFRNWILSATATNMAYMLSAQLAAMELNVRQGFVNGGALIYAPGTDSANAAGFATVNAVMAEADAALLANGNTTAAGADRTHQEALKNALDRANNNQTFVLAWHDTNNNGVVDAGEIY